MQLYTKRYWKKHVPNLRIAINQTAVFMQDNALSHSKVCQNISFRGGCYCYGVACSKPRHESSWECLEITKQKT